MDACVLIHANEKSCTHKLTEARSLTHLLTHSLSHTHLLLHTHTHTHTHTITHSLSLSLSLTHTRMGKTGRYLDTSTCTNCGAKSLRSCSRRGKSTTKRRCSIALFALKYLLVWTPVSFAFVCATLHPCAASVCLRTCVLICSWYLDSLFTTHITSDATHFAIHPRDPALPPIGQPVRSQNGARRSHCSFSSSCQNSLHHLCPLVFCHLFVLFLLYSSSSFFSSKS